MITSLTSNCCKVIISIASLCCIMRFGEIIKFSLIHTNSLFYYFKKIPLLLNFYQKSRNKIIQTLSQFNNLIQNPPQKKKYIHREIDNYRYILQPNKTKSNFKTVFINLYNLAFSLFSNQNAYVIKCLISI